MNKIHHKEFPKKQTCGVIKKKKQTYILEKPTVEENGTKVGKGKNWKKRRGELWNVKTTKK